jgi:hypothetical protein
MPKLANANIMLPTAIKILVKAYSDVEKGELLRVNK